MERNTEIQMEAGLGGVDHAVSMYIKRKFVSVRGFGGVKVQRLSFVISELDGWRATN
jgi:1-aminocyclopropane-1-carboxylate deaminase/D-cysteine desulfhydrase-like pyridoxal-dependent ACC family enzyme